MANEFEDRAENVVRDPEPSQPPATLTNEEKQMALFAHLGSLVGGIIVPLIIWLIKKDTSRFVDDQGKEALNFQITLLISSLVIGLITCGIGIPVVLVIAIVYSIIGGMAASRGEWYRYPSWTIRLIK
jgi:uncharacterized Tic20 family protein